MSLKKNNSPESYLIEKLKEYIESSTVSHNSFVRFSENNPQLLDALYGMALEVNREISNYLGETSDLQNLIVDYFLTNQQYSEEENSTSFKDSAIYNDIDTHIQNIVHIIQSIPVEYTFALPLNIKDSRLSSLDQPITSDISLRGLELDANLYWQYLLPQSGYGDVQLDPNRQGDNLSITGKYKGYIFKFLNNPSLESFILSEVKRSLALLTMTNILTVKSHKHQAWRNICVNFYESSNYLQNFPLETSLSVWIQRLELSASAFHNNTVGLLGIIRNQSDPTDIENFIENIKDVKLYEDIKTSPLGEGSLFKKFDVALGWYLDALTAENINNRLIHLCIVIEILLGSENREALKKIELPERIALLIAKKVDEREKYQTITRSAFTYRNAIVHNGELIPHSGIEQVNDFHALVLLVLQHEFEILKKSLHP